MSIAAATHHKRARELEQLIRSPDPNVRRYAEYHLKIAMDQIKLDLAAAKHDIGNAELSSSSSDEMVVDASPNESAATDPVSGHSSLGIIDDNELGNQLDQFNEPDLEWDNERPLASPEPEDRDQEINIRTPNVSINIRPSIGSTPRRPIASTPAARRPTHSGMSSRDFDDWLKDVSPTYGRPDHGPLVTRSGRVSKPPERFGETEEDLKRRERDDLIIALDRSVADLHNTLTRARTNLSGGSNNLEHSNIQEEDPQEGPSGIQVPPSSRGRPPRDLDSSDD